MSVDTLSFTTGVATLPDVGALSYNGCSFSPLFATNVSGACVKDEARRTTMYMQYVIEVDGYVTMPNGATSIAPTMKNLERLLTAQGGHLVYEGRGLDLNVNPNGGGDRDVAWGPVPELLGFQPLGGGRSAKVTWKVTVRVPVVKRGTAGAKGGLAGRLLQFNYETSVGYGEDGYSNISIRGILEIPLTRQPNQRTRTLTETADDYRSIIEDRIMAGIDLERFRVTRRNFPLSRDKRVLTWDFEAEEKGYMDLPPDCPMARGSYSVRPAKSGMGLCNWLCTLRATYTVRHDRPRRTAWGAFLLLLRLRMAASENAPVIDASGNQNPPRGNLVKRVIKATLFGTAANAGLEWMDAMQKTINNVKSRALLIDFNIDEGLYLDSRTISFSASWRLITPFSHILLASGVWTKVPERDAIDKNVWATSIRDIQGHKSWLPNKVDPKLDIIVDFGS